jgi:hypothetical protein
MGPHAPEQPRQQPSLPEFESRWHALMAEFEEASHEVVTSLHDHETLATQQALDALVRAQVRRNTALSNMLDLLDRMDYPISARRP